ncbi:unnamed protein product [Nyctereutes procyonoides]|uniref:(raccoon dog) hypothetical protein n=1 Tax=Nyctereutes procyonoides TaxID=34880 RepID=A0A811ZTX9_NYCPR|nr:unnamed protein product [Nyctereutes procyonoides]
MENYLFPQKYIIASWLSSGPTSWAINIIFTFLCGLGLFFLLFSYFRNDPSLPPHEKHRNSRKHRVEPRRRSSRSQKKAQTLKTLKACRDCLQELEEVRDLISLLQSHLGRVPDQEAFHQFLHQEAPEEVSKAASAGAHQPCSEPGEDAAPVLAPSPSPAPLTGCPLPLASTLSPSPTTSSISLLSHFSLSASWPPDPFLPLDGFSHQPLALSPSLSSLPSSEACTPPLTDSSAPAWPDSTLTLPLCDSMAPPLNTIPQSSSPHTPWLASPVPVISGLGHSSCPISALSCWQATAKAWSFSTSTHLESQQEPLSHQPPKVLLWGDSTNRQVEANIPSFINPDIQKLLEILITKRIELKIWKKEESDDHLNSLGSRCKSPGDKQDTLGCQSFWSMRSIQERLLSPEKPPYHGTSGDNLQQKCSQLFWGLPFLHSESLVATVSMAGSPLELPSVIFNELSQTLPLPMQANIASHLSPAQSLPDAMVQPQPLTPTLSQSPPLPLALPQPQAHFAPSVPIELPPSPPKMGIPCPASENNTPSFISTAIQNLECHFLKKQLERDRTLPAVVKRSQEVFSQVSPNFLQDDQAPEAHESISVLPEDLISPELREQLEWHLWKRFMRHQSGLPHKIQLSVKLIQPQDEALKVTQAHNQHRPMWPSASRDRSCQAVQKTGSRNPARTMPGKNLGKDTRSSVRKIQKDLCRGSSTSPWKDPGKGSEESDPDIMKHSTSIQDKKHPEKILRAHLGRKLGQIREGQIPVDVHRSRLAVNHASDLPGKPSIHRKTGKPAISKGWKPCMTTSHDFSILSPYTQRMLEAHIIRFRVKHRWSLPLKVLKPINLFKLKKGSIFPWSSTPHSATSISKARSKAKFLGKPPQPHRGEKEITKEAVPPSETPLPAPQPKCEEIPQTLEGISLGEGHGPPEAPVAGQEARPPSQTLTYSFVGRIWHSETVLGAFEYSSLESSPSPATTTSEPRRETGGRASRDSCCNITVLELNLESQSLSAKESREAAESEEAPAWGDTLEPSVLPNDQTIHVDLRRSGSSGSSNGPSASVKLVAQDPEEPCLDEQLRESAVQRLVESENQPQAPISNVLLEDCETGVILQDCATNSLLQECQSDMFLAADMLASRGSLSDFQSVSSEDASTSQMLLGLVSSGQDSQWQPEPLVLQAPSRSQSKLSIPAQEREYYRRPNAGEHEEELGELKVFQISEMNHHSRDKASPEPSRSKFCPVLLKKEEVPPESQFRRKVRHFLQWILPGKGKGQEDPGPKGKPSPASARNRASGRSAPGRGPAEAQVLVTAVGQILEEKMVPHQGLRAPECNCYKRDQRAAAGPNVCYHRVLSYQEQRRVMRETASKQQAIPKGHSCPNRAEWIPGRDNRWAFPSRMTGCPGRACQHRPMVPGASGRPPHPHCPRHCLFQRYVSSGQSVCAFHGFPGRTVHTVQRKTYFSHVSTSSMG